MQSLKDMCKKRIAIEKRILISCKNCRLVPWRLPQCVFYGDSLRIDFLKVNFKFNLSNTQKFSHKVHINDVFEVRMSR